MRLSPAIITFFCATILLLMPAATRADDAATTKTLGKWQQLFVDRVALFEAENKTLAPGARPIVFAGDSITQGMPIRDLFPGEQVLNRGIGSDGTADQPGAPPPHYRGLSNRLDSSILDPNPRVLFILIGTNDVGNAAVPFDYWESELTKILDRVKTDIPDCKVVLHTLPPTSGKYERLMPRFTEYNVRLRKLAEDRGLALIDLQKILADDKGLLPADWTGDGLHFKRPAYDVWAAEARKYFPEEK